MYIDVMNIDGPDWSQYGGGITSQKTIFFAVQACSYDIIKSGSSCPCVDDVLTHALVLGMLSVR